MKISYITMQFPVPSETFASLDINTLIEQGHEVKVYALRFKHLNYDSLISERGHENLQVTHFNFASILNTMHFIVTNPLKFFKVFFWIFRCCCTSPKHLFKSFILLPSSISIFMNILDDKPEVVHLFWGHYPSIVGYMVKEYMPKTIVSLFLGAHDLIVSFPCSKHFSRQADLIFTHSKANVSLISSLSAKTKNIYSIPRGTRLNFFSEFACYKFQDFSKPIFITASRLIEDKGVDDVLLIFSIIIKYKPNAELYIAGDGPFRSKLELLADELNVSSRVIFLGHIGHDKLLSFMSKSHIFLLMSRYKSERLPNVVKEAMYQRCVIITTDTIGIDELITHEKDGYIVPKSDIDTATQYVKKCISYQKESEKMAQRAHEKIVNEFDVNLSMKKYCTLWKSVIEGSENK